MKSEVIFEGAHYTACAMSDGMLIVTSNRKQRGVAIKAGPSAAEWSEYIRTAADHSEAHALCSAIMQSIN